MNDLKDELSVKMTEYHADILLKMNAVYLVNTSYGAAFSSYCRVAALAASKKIIKIPESQEMFFNEALNDFLSSHVMIMLGSSRVALTSLRAIIENFLYYFYYIDHEVEFEQWKQGKFKIKFSELFEYIKKHPKIISAKTESNVDDLQNEYGVLSMAVHGSSDKFMMTSQDNFPHIFQDKEMVVSQWNTRAKNVFKCIITLILSFHRDEFVTASHRHERNIIRIALGERQATALNKKISVSL